jgi:hypothetical protein
MKKYPVTPDGRYFIVNDRLWRCTDPALSGEKRASLVKKLMEARRAVATAKKMQDPDALKKARLAVNSAKVALGERGAPWWNDGAPDYTRRLVGNSPYAQWYAAAKHVHADKTAEDSDGL